MQVWTEVGVCGHVATLWPETGPGPAEKVPRAPVEIVGPPRRPAASVRKAQCDPWPGVSGGWGNGMMKA